MILMDLHVHPTPWENGVHGYRTYVESAIQNGVSILGFAEHGPACHPHPKYRGLEPPEIEPYVLEIQKLKEEYRSQIQIFCGLELDFMPDRLGYYQELKESYPFDYFLASVHLIDDWHVDDPSSLPASEHRNADPQTLYWLYYRQVKAAADTGMFQALSHVDYIRRSLPHPPDQPPEFAHDLFDEVAHEISSNGIAVEINTRGMFIPSSAEFHPTMPFLHHLIRAGVPFTLGSDAHEANRVGDALPQARGLLRDLGVENLFYFKKGGVLQVEI
jgi:histidinol-phosphatase (PHP family)